MQLNTIYYFKINDYECSITGYQYTTQVKYKFL